MLIFQLGYEKHHRTQPIHVSDIPNTEVSLRSIKRFSKLTSNFFPPATFYVVLSCYLYMMVSAIADADANAELFLCDVNDHHSHFLVKKV